MKPYSVYRHSVAALFKVAPYQLQAAWKNAASIGSYGLLVAGLLYVLLAREVYVGDSTFWFLIISVLTLARILLGIYFTRAAEDESEVHSSLGLYVIITLAVSLAWGGVIYLLPTETPVEIDFIVVATTSLVAVIGMMSSYTVLLGAIAYLVPITVLQVLWMGLYQPEYYSWIIILLAIFALAMFALVLNFDRQYLQIRRLLRDNAGLSDDLESAHTKLSEHADTISHTITRNFKFSGMIEALPDAVLIIDADKKIVYANQSCLKKFAYTHEELIGRPFDVLLDEQGSSRETIDVSLNNALASLQSITEKDVFLCRHQGEVFNVELLFIPVLEEGKKILYVHIRDTSDQKYIDAFIDEIKQKELAQNALLIEKEKLQTYVDNIESIMLVLNDKLEIELVNNKGREFLGVDSQAVISFADIEGLLKKNYRDDVAGFLQNILERQTGEISFFQNTIITKDSETRYLEWYLVHTLDRHGKHCILASGIDISQRKQLEELITSVAISLQNHGAEGILNSLVKGLATTLGADGVLIAQRSEAAHDKLLSLAVCCDGDLQGDLEISLAGSPMEYALQGQNHAILGKLGEKYPNDPLISLISAEAYLSVPLYSSNREISGVLALFYRHKLTNINLERNICNIYSVIAAAEIERLNNIHAKEHVERQLQHAQKMESIGQLTGGVAHDFNNMLASMLGYAELALLKIDPTDNKLTQYLNNIHETGEKAKDLISQMLTFSRQIRGEKRLLDLAASVEDAVSMVRPMLPSSIKLRTAYDESLALVDGDSVQINQAIINLIINARDAIGEKGEIDIAVTINSHSHGFCTSCLEEINAEMLEISIADSGDGVAYEHLERIFEPFVTNKDIGKGTGMGLAMVHGIVHEHGGHIIVETEKGKGSKFRLLFPVSEKQMVEQKQPLLANIQIKEGNGKRVMVVDDELMVASLLDEVLSNYHYAVETYTNSMDALQAYEINPKNYDLVITDHTMPSLTGAELSATILKLNPDQAILLCTGYSDYMNEEKAERIGVAAFMYKPLDHMELMRTVDLLTDIRI